MEDGGESLTMARTKKTIITPENFAKILHGLEIIRIDVDDFSGKVLDRVRMVAHDGNRVVSLSEKNRYECGEAEKVVVWHAYNVTVTSDDNGQPDKLMVLTVEFRVEYASKEPFTTEFFEQFRNMSLRVQTAPFARAWIQDHCLRMGVPALIMPLIRTK